MGHLIMRAVIFLAIVGVAFGLNICKGVNKNDISSAYATARLGAAAIFGSSCPGFDLDTVAFSGACKSLVKQATCYGLKAASHYDRDVINYGHLAKDVKNIESLGNQACAEAPACFRQVKAAMEDCLANNANFVQDTIDAAETAYKENFEAQVAEWANSNSGSLLGDLASMAMDRFSSADDIQAFINEHLTDDVVADAQAAAVEAQKLAQQWCDEGCTSTTARFLEGIFNHMNGGQCVMPLNSVVHARTALHLTSPGTRYHAVSRTLSRRALGHTTMSSRTTKQHSTNTQLQSEADCPQPLLQRPQKSKMMLLPSSNAFKKSTPPTNPDALKALPAWNPG